MAEALTKDKTICADEGGPVGSIAWKTFVPDNLGLGAGVKATAGEARGNKPVPCSSGLGPTATVGMMGCFSSNFILNVSPISLSATYRWKTH